MMIHARPHTPRPTRQEGGFVLVLVIFLIVVLAGAAVAISQLTVDTSAAQNQALQTTRAEWFAQSGIERGVYMLLEDEAECELDNETNADFPGLTLSVTCEPEDYNGITLWRLQATVESTDLIPTHEEYVWQRMTAVVEVEAAP